MTKFNKNKEFQDHIVPLLDELMTACAAFGIPIFVSCCTSNDESGTHYESNVLPAVCKSLVLKDDWFTKFVNVTLGFETKLPTEIILDDPEAIEDENEGQYKISNKDLSAEVDEEDE